MSNGSRTAFGYTVVEPGTGPLASGQSGVGRLAEIPHIVDAVIAATTDRPIRQPDPAKRPPATRDPARDADLEGRHVVVTAGGTREAIDPVRYIGNRSTGKMGVAIAEAALDRGAQVTLIVGHTEVELPGHATVIRAESTAQMRAALHADRQPRGRSARVRRPDHGGRHRRLHPDPVRRHQARARRTRSRSSSCRRRISWATSAGSPTASMPTANPPAGPSNPAPSSSGSPPRPAASTAPRTSSGGSGSTSSWPTT